MDDATLRWSDALGAKGGVNFYEEGTEDEDSIRYCRVNNQYNPTLPHNILIVKYKEGDAGTYKPGQGYVPTAEDNDLFRHLLEFDPAIYEHAEGNDQNAGGALTHELGKSTS